MYENRSNWAWSQVRIVERAKHKRTWKSPHARKGNKRQKSSSRRVSPFLNSIQFNSTQFSRGVIFTRARVSLALLSLGKNGGLLACSLSRRSLGSTLSLRTLRDIYFGCLLFHRRITSHLFSLSPSRCRPRGKGKARRWRMYSSKRVLGTPY